MYTAIVSRYSSAADGCVTLRDPAQAPHICKLEGGPDCTCKLPEASDAKLHRLNLHGGEAWNDRMPARKESSKQPPY